MKYLCRFSSDKYFERMKEAFLEDVGDKSEW